MTRYNPSDYRHERQPTARFWDWCGDGWVKLSIRPGATLRRTTGGPHEEGYSYTAQMWHHTGDGVEYTTATWGTDCDGRHDRADEMFAPIAFLAALPMDGPDAPAANAGIAVPQWTGVSSRQRDDTAEAAGY